MREQIVEFTKKYGPYLEEVRKRLFVFTYVFGACFFVSFVFVGPTVRFFFRFFGENNVQVFVNSPFQFFTVALYISLFTTIFLTFPLAVYFIYSFLKSAMKKTERKTMRRVVVISLLLFLSGFLFGLGVMYYAIIYLAKVNAGLGLTNMWNMSIVISQILLASVLLGLYFQYPLILTILVRMGFMDVNTLRRKRKIMTVITVVVVSILPPPETIATIAMLVPLLLMYEITILINRKYATIIKRSY
jgi:sec-independent protein translocase protein TatC